MNKYFFIVVLLVTFQIGLGQGFDQVSPIAGDYQIGLDEEGKSYKMIDHSG
jgi:hypothetical protein